MLSSARKVCFLNKEWHSVFALSQISKQIINLIISHFVHGTNHSFDNESPLHFGAFSLRSPMKHIIKYSGAHRGNSVQQTPGAKIIIYFPSTESTRLKTAHLIVSLSSGRVRDTSQSYLLDRKHRKKGKKKKSLNLQSGWVTPGGRCGGLVVYGISYCLTLHVSRLKARTLDLFLSKSNYA